MACMWLERCVAECGGMADGVSTSGGEKRKRGRPRGKRKERCEEGEKVIGRSRRKVVENELVDNTETEETVTSSKENDESVRPSMPEERDVLVSCLESFHEVTATNGSNLTALLKRAMSIEELDDTSWLSSTLIDLVLSQFAKHYPTVEYLSMDFLLYLSHSKTKKSDYDGLTDILGRLLRYQPHRPIIFLSNKGNIHWTLIRAIIHPHPELQFFEPMGKLSTRSGHLSYRYVPRDVVHWLDICSPLKSGKSWLTVSISAITSQHQYTSFDCGVACLLYAEKCGLGYSKEEINQHTSQEDITSYRRSLQEFLRKSIQK